MGSDNFSTPSEIAASVLQSAVTKVSQTTVRQLLLGILAGAFIAFASEGSNMAAFNLLADPGTYGLGRTLAGLVFGTGLMLVILAGGELFTGNMLILTGVFSRKVRIRQLIQNWFVVYIGNLIGSMLIAILMVQTGLFNAGANLLGGVTIRIAAAKTDLPFIYAVVLGILCNWLVCLAVWLACGAKDMAGKVLVIFFPIWLFVTSGFEHSVANMYYIPAGILAKANPDWAEASCLTAESLARLNWMSFLAGNLLPVTIGNIIGGGLFVACTYWFVYLKKRPGA